MALPSVLCSPEPQPVLVGSQLKSVAGDFFFQLKFTFNIIFLY